MDKIALIRLSSLGDIILTEPVTRVLKDNFPHSEIVFISRESYRPILEMFPAIDKLELLQIPGQHENLTELRRYIKGLDQKFDLVLDLHKNIRSKIILRNTPADRKISYKNHRFQRQMAVWFKTRKNYQTTTDKYLCTLEHLKLRIALTIPEIAVSQDQREKALIYLQANNFKNKKFAILAVGASHPPKQFPLTRFAEIVEMLYIKYGLQILIVNDEEIDETPFKAFIKAGILKTAINLDMQLLAGILCHSRLTISNDSGIMHLSAALKIPTLGLFGPTHPVLGFEPLGEFSQALTTNEPCSPCSVHGRKACTKPEQYCFTNMSMSMIETALKAILR